MTLIDYAVMCQLNDDNFGYMELTRKRYYMNNYCFRFDTYTTIQYMKSMLLTSYEYLTFGSR